jgi:hypothetical protein
MAFPVSEGTSSPQRKGNEDVGSLTAFAEAQAVFYFAK